MTDFLHPQSTPTPPQADANLSPAQERTAPVESSNTETGVEMMPHSESAQRVAAQAQTIVRERVDSGPIKRNFSEVNKNFAKEHDEEGEGGQKRVVRKESPLFIHYYQSVFLLLITLFIAAGYFLLNPLIMSFKETNQNIQASLQEKEDADSFLRSIDRSIQAAKTISPDTLDRINEALPKDSQIPILLKLFSQLADQNKVEMGGIQFSPKEASNENENYGGYALAPIQISLSVNAPSYAVMRKYLEDLQTNVQLMEVQSIAVAGDSTSGKFTYALTLTTYYLQKVARTPSSSGSMLPGNSPLPPTAPSVGNDI